MDIFIKKNQLDSLISAILIEVGKEINFPTMPFKNAKARFNKELEASLWNKRIFQKKILLIKEEIKEDAWFNAGICGC